jgi:filamentous hemagglutinin
LSEEILAAGADATITAGVQTAIEGGSFLNNLKTAGVQDAAADIAYGIGDAFNGQPGSLGVPNASDPFYVLAHAALGCASSAALGTGCAGGAIGAATSAIVSPYIVSAMDPTGVALDPSQTAALAGLSTLLGGAAAGLAGANAQGGELAAQNEALNNTSQHTAEVLAACAQSAFCKTLLTISPATTTAVLLAVSSSSPQSNQSSSPQTPSSGDDNIDPSSGSQGQAVSTSGGVVAPLPIPACLPVGMVCVPATLPVPVSFPSGSSLSNAINAIFSTGSGGSGDGSGNSTGSGDGGNNSLLDPQAENHVLNGDGTGGGHLSGVGLPGKSEFPTTWGAQDITNAISDIATDPATQWSAPSAGNGYVTGTGTINGVDIKVVVNPSTGRIVTGYPTNLPRNPK